MDIFEAKIGTRLELELVNSLGEKKSPAYVSQLIDIVSNEDIVLSCPIFESRFVFIASGSKIRVLFFHEKHGLLSFNATVSSRERNGNMLLLHTKITSRIEKIQRRQYYRLDCNLDASYKIRPADTSSEDANTESNLQNMKKAITRNLSGSGACIITEELIPKDSLLDLHINLNGSDCVKALCSIIRSSKAENSRDFKYEIGLYFNEISPKDQDILIRFIFDQQRLLLKKNMDLK